MAITIDDLATVERLHAKALAFGGADEGEPGPRGEKGMCFGYVRDLDGNKLAFYSVSG